MTGKKKGRKKKEEGICTYVDLMYVGKRCGRSLYDDEHCIFHSQDIEGKNDKFNDAFWKEFERQIAHEEKYDFTGFIFAGEISFLNRILEKDVYFSDAQFSGAADFRGAQFSGTADFMDAQFSGRADFVGAQFSGAADFVGAQFSGAAYFKIAKFSGEADFVGAQFSGGADFRVAQFSGAARFERAKFTGDSVFLDVYFKDFNKCNMMDTTFYNVYGLLEYLAENKKKIKHPRGIKYLHYRCKPILGEATVSRLPLLSREIRDDVYLMSFKDKHPILHFLWWLFADCGRSFWRWAAWCIFFACLFGFLFWGMGTDNFKIPEGHTPFAYFYYSIVTFTTLGFGDIVPMTLLGRILVTIEVILGYLGLGGLISILANKLARRS